MNFDQLCAIVLRSMKWTTYVVYLVHTYVPYFFLDV